jgi:hypothetical protein
MRETLLLIAADAPAGGTSPAVSQWIQIFLFIRLSKLIAVSFELSAVGKQGISKH